MWRWTVKLACLVRFTCCSLSFLLSVFFHPSLCFRGTWSLFWFVQDEKGQTWGWPLVDPRSKHVASLLGQPWCTSSIVSRFPILRLGLASSCFHAYLKGRATWTPIQVRRKTQTQNKWAYCPWTCVTLQNFKTQKQYEIRHENNRCSLITVAMLWSGSFSYFSEPLCTAFA